MSTVSSAGSPQPLVALTIDGSDSGGGAGLQADLKTFGALGLFGVSVVTAVTAQNTAEVAGVVALDPTFVELQLDTVLRDLPVKAVKTGMLASTATVRMVGRWAAEGRLPHLVVDPVLLSSTGTPLLDDGAVDAYRELLLPHAELVTPNLREAALLTGRALLAMDGTDAMVAAAMELAALGPAVVVKGGHLAGPHSPDVLATGGTVQVLEEDRVVTSNDHGTGCTLSAAIAAGLAQGLELTDSWTRAKRYVTGALAGAAGWRLGQGRGPLDHFHVHAVAGAVR